MLRQDKEGIVEELAAQLGSAETLIVADYRGLTNKQLEGLRDTLLESGARLRIVKNSLTRRAAEQAGAEALLVMLEGPTAIAFVESGGDPAAVAKALAQTARETNVLELRGGVLEGKTLSGAQVSQLATLPPVDVLRGQVLGAVVAPLTQLLALVSAPLRDVVGLIDARINQLEEQGETSLSAANAAESEDAAASEEAASADEHEDEPAEAEASDAAAPIPEGSAAAEPSDSDEPEPMEQAQQEKEKEEEE